MAFMVQTVKVSTRALLAPQAGSELKRSDRSKRFLRSMTFKWFGRSKRNGRSGVTGRSERTNRFISLGGSRRMGG